jgi:plastocyanin
MKSSIMAKVVYSLALGLLLASPTSFGEEKLVEHNMLMDHGDGHLMDMDGGMVMGQNKDKLPGGCTKISEDAQITVRAGHKYSKKFPGTMFAFDQQEWRVKPCARLTVTFINEDRVRHQWMMHGLPKYIYDKGMFHLEVTGPAKITGTLILPKEDRTYLVHCDIAQHMEKGMKGQLVVGNGSGVFPSIPGLTDLAIPDTYGQPETVATGAVETQPVESVFSGALIIGLVLGLFGAPLLVRIARERFKGMSAKEILAYFWGLLTQLVNALIQFITWLYRTVTQRGKYLPKG